MNMILLDAASNLNRSARLLKRVDKYIEATENLTVEGAKAENKVEIMSFLSEIEAEISAAQARISSFRSDGNWY